MTKGRIAFTSTTILLSCNEVYKHINNPQKRSSDHRTIQPRYCSDSGWFSSSPNKFLSNNQGTIAYRITLLSLLHSRIA